MSQLIDIIEDGFPDNRNSLPDSLRPYYQFRDGLSTFYLFILFPGAKLIQRLDISRRVNKVKDQRGIVLEESKGWCCA